MKKVSFKAVLVALVCMTTVTVGETAAKDLKIAALKGWPPFSGRDLPNQGFSNDIAKTALERLGHNVKIHVMPWARALEMTKRGKFEVLPAVWFSEERAKHLVFADPIAKNRVVFVKKSADDFQFTKLSDLNGKSIGIVKGYDYREDFLQSNQFTRQNANSIIINLKKLLADRVDLTVGDELVVRHAVNEAMPGRADEIAYTEGTLSEKPLHVTFSRKLDDADSLVKEFNAEITKMRQDGTYDQILANHGLK